MAKKEPEMIDRFKVSAEVPKEQLGHIIAELAKMGLQDIHYELITDVLSYKQPGKRFDTNGADYLREFLKDNPTFTRQQVVEHFVANGRTKDSGSNAIYILANKREISRVSEGNYQRADVRTLTGPKARAITQEKKAKVSTKAEKAAKIARTRATYTTPNVDFILARIAKKPKFTLPEMEKYFTDHGRKKKSVGALLTGLLAMHKIRRVGTGQYVGVAKRDYAAERERMKASRAAKEKLNGATAPASPEAGESVTNG